MAQTIHILPEHLASKIAAGEVVQRPASAVKELVENSIDAGAAAITVIVNDAGTTLIRVVDDGTGMSPDDAELAFARHATSKIRTYDDLEHIRTLGFRGEALASIAAVSQVTLHTRQVSDDIAVRIRCEGGAIVERTRTSAPTGTSIEVKHLFYNTPARRNFLKSRATEFRHIFDAVQRVALANHDLAVTFVSDGETIYTLRPSSPAERLKELFGERLAQTVFAFQETSEAVRIHGFLGKPAFARRTRTEQYLYLGRRPIVSRNLQHAVYQGYENLLEKGSFPLYVLFIESEPNRVDVNVHPSKLEVKFADDQGMYRFVLSAVRKALSDHDLVPSVDVRDASGDGGESGLRLRRDVVTAPAGGWTEYLRPTREEPGPITDTTETSLFRRPAADGTVSPAGTSTAGAEQSHPANQPWQLHRKYIIVPLEEGLMIVDQHAAHERILYERILARMEASDNRSQQLLFPHNLEMTPGDAALVRQLLPMLERIGFSVKFFGSSTVVVDGVPTDVKPGDEATILRDVVDLFKEDEQKVKLEPRERLAKTFACKAAIKSGDPLNVPEMSSLLDQLFATTIPFVCPHGRPVVIKLPLAELDRRFGRTS